MAVYAPSLMLQTGDPVATVYVVLKAFISVGLWGAAAIGYLRARLTILERIWATASAFLLVVALPITDEIGLALFVGFAAFHWWRTRNAAGERHVDRTA